MEDLIQSLFFNYPFTKIVWDKLYIIVPYSFMLAYTGIIFISVTGKILGSASSRISFAKCSRQLAKLGLCLGWLLLIGGRLWLYFNKNKYISGSFEDYLLEICWLLLSIGVFLVSIYYCLWGILKNMPVLHATLGILGAVENCLTLCSILLTARILARSSHSMFLETNLPDLFPNVWNDPAWTAAAYTLPLVFALAGAFGSFWIFLRRKKDDFGRDYYKAMLPWTAAWARNSWVVLWLLFVIANILKISMGQMEPDWLINESIWGVIWVIPLLLWSIFCKLKFPLRNTWMIFAALVVSLSFIPAYYQDIINM